MNLIRNIFGGDTITLGSGKKVKEPKKIGVYILVIIMLLFYISFKVTGFSFKVIFERGHQFLVILKQMMPPKWSYIPDVSKPLLDTIKMSILGSLIGSIFALPFSAIASKNINPNSLSLNTMRFLLSIFRTLPTLIVASITTYIFGLGTFAGTVAIAIFTCAIVSKMLYEYIETIDMMPFEAMLSMGSTRTRAFVSSIIPQISANYISLCLYSFEINVRHAAILGYVGAGGIGLLLDENLQLREYQYAASVIFMLLITVVIIESASRYFRSRLN